MTFAGGALDFASSCGVLAVTHIAALRDPAPRGHWGRRRVFARALITTVQGGRRTGGGSSRGGRPCGWNGRISCVDSGSGSY